jgi:glycerate dehydrogenase
VDAAAARELGITVTNIPDYSAASVAQHTIALILGLANHVGRLDAAVHAGRWARSPDWCFWERPLRELSGLTLGIVGLGSVGRRLAMAARAIGMRVIAHDPAPRAAEGVEEVDLDTVFSESDIVSLHCPLTDETRGMVGEARLAMMKPSAYLVNTARGGLVDEDALARALDEGRMAGAAVDVIREEPPRSGSPLIAAKNCVVTPHVAWATTASRERLIEAAASNLEAFIAGRPVNVVA